MRTRIIITVILTFFSASAHAQGIPQQTWYTEDCGSQKRLSGSIFQTLDRHNALVSSLQATWMLSTRKAVLYDRKRIVDLFILIGTYSYKTADKTIIGSNGVTIIEPGTIKTVPVYVFKSEYLENKEYWDRLIDQYKNTNLLPDNYPKEDAVNVSQDKV